jgi:hypothetical protein
VTFTTKVDGVTTVAANDVNAIQSAILLTAAASPDVLVFGTITRDSNGAATSATVTWPDGTTGAYTGTASASFPGAVDSYTITYGTLTYTQPTVTRDSTGAVTSRPAITVT